MFEHYCHCGKWGSFGYGFFPRDGKRGTWYCREHVPPVADPKQPPWEPEEVLVEPEVVNTSNADCEQLSLL